jgi:hypothetical protein
MRIKVQPADEMPKRPAQGALVEIIEEFSRALALLAGCRSWTRSPTAWWAVR